MLGPVLKEMPEKESDTRKVPRACEGHVVVDGVPAKGVSESQSGLHMLSAVFSLEVKTKS